MNKRLLLVVACNFGAKPPVDTKRRAMTAIEAEALLPWFLPREQTNGRTGFVLFFAGRFGTFVNYPPIFNGQRALLKGPRCRRRW